MAEKTAAQKSTSRKPLACVVLAAGMGTRMKSKLPKVMHKIAGRPMINWLLGTLESLGPERIIVVTGPGMKDLERAVSPHSFVTQHERNGTGGALMSALPALEGFEGNVLVLLGDTPLVRAETLEALIAEKEADLLCGLSVLGTQMEEPFGYGRLIFNKDGTLKTIIEEKDAHARQKAIKTVNGGVFCIESKRLKRWLLRIDNNNAAGEYYITSLPAIAEKDSTSTRVHITPDATELQGCNNRGDLAILEGLVQQRLRKFHLENGVSMIDPASVYFHYDTAIEPDVLIEPGVFFGPGVSVASGAHIKAYCHIEGAKIGRDVSLGPFARLRPGTQIGDKSKIGNFVEIKKGRLGRAVKVSHLSYIGDAQIGDDTNFGCGAITVNYDGFQKHDTIVGKGVMVGSNVNLVAPIRIDDGAFIAAGSTITEDVPADALSMSRSPAEVRAGWAATYRKLKAAAVKKRKKAAGKTGGTTSKKPKKSATG